jgi:hypothetical protein
VNQSENFVDTTSGADTNAIEGTWNELKMLVLPLDAGESS